MSRLQNKVAIVTGASKGIGAGIAKELAAEGAAVVVNYVSSKKDADCVVAQITASVMLLITMVHIGLLFVYGKPEWKPIVSAYLGLLLMGGCFISAGLFISSLTKNQIVAVMATFAVFLFLWVINWIGSFSGPQVEKITSYLSIIEHFEDFAKGVIDTTHVIYYLSFMTFGLFLTAKSVDSERWRG